MSLLQSDVVEWLLSNPDPVREVILRMRAQRALEAEQEVTPPETDVPSEPQNGSDS